MANTSPTRPTNSTPTGAKTNAQAGSLADSLSSTFAAVVIPLAFVVAYLIYKYVFGDASHFQGGNNENLPLQGDYLGTIYAGGIIVPILVGLLILVITFAFERFFTISKAEGKGSVARFVARVKGLISRGEIDAALAEADKQRGSVGNVVKAGLLKYKEVDTNYNMDQDRKLLAIQKDIEETTQLEMPMLERNLVIIATIASIATLMGLLGTVIGMIRAFAALANAGAPDAVALATGISEALINTAFGIGTSALAIVFYNYFTSKIDGLTHGIDEVGYSITQAFATKANKNAEV
ncbi:MAG: MotA/TolQ/ExbB proton channel family protein [Ferruginibacter sp.]|nr:MotA/TolQ/ExbB proton channel family protein [Cytophagales bacterium]